jgi:hypothetical protein
MGASRTVATTAQAADVLTQRRARTRPGHARPGVQVSLAMLWIVALPGCWVPTHPPVEALPGHFTNAGRLEAMFSIHAHYFWPDRRFPSGLRTIPLRDAAEYLAADARENRAGWSRRRRAIAELAAVGLKRREFRDALRDLGVDPDEIESALDAREHARKLSTSERETIVADLPMVAGKPIDCASQWTKLKVSVSPAEAISASYLVEIHVPLGPDIVAKALDAQSWDHCSKFFCPPERTYLAHLDSGGNPVMDPALPPASTYKGLSLFEQFTCPLQECGYTTFRNMLNVDSYFTGPPIHYQATYHLRKYLSGTASGGLGQQDLELFIDGGQHWAETAASGSGSIVHGDKTVWLRNPTALGIFNGGLQLMEKELAGELAETACCTITNPPPKTCPP